MECGIRKGERIGGYCVTLLEKTRASSMDGRRIVAEQWTLGLALIRDVSAGWRPKQTVLQSQRWVTV